ncbi:MAG: hypothetical protein PVI78_04755 [Anaerolineales bacterium]
MKEEKFEINNSCTYLLFQLTNHALVERLAQLESSAREITIRIVSMMIPLNKNPASSRIEDDRPATWAMLTTISDFTKEFLTIFHDLLLKTYTNRSIGALSHAPGIPYLPDVPNLREADFDS